MEELIRFVQGSTSDYDRLRHIEQMKQGPEKCAIYITRMEMAFRGLRVQPSALEKRDMVIRGLKPVIRNALAGNIYLRDLEDLRVASQQVERMVVTPKEIHAIVEEKGGEADLIQPQTSTGGGKKPHMSQFGNKPRNVSRQESRKFTATQQPEKKSVRCFRCGQAGHYRRDCKNAAKIFCYGCGAPEVKISECPKCHPGNE